MIFLIFEFVYYLDLVIKLKCSYFIGESDNSTLPLDK